MEWGWDGATILVTDVYAINYIVNTVIKFIQETFVVLFIAH